MSYGTVSGSGSRSGSGTFYTDRLTVTNSTISNNQGDGLLPDTTFARVIGSTISGNGGSGVDTSEYPVPVSLTARLLVILAPKDE
jgi:hypothetical protein